MHGSIRRREEGRQLGESQRFISTPKSHPAERLLAKPSPTRANCLSRACHGEDGKLPITVFMDPPQPTPRFAHRSPDMQPQQQQDEHSVWLACRLVSVPLRSRLLTAQ